MFGEVLSEITEELFEEKNEANAEKLPLVGNVTYVVTMRLKISVSNAYSK